jgi:ATP-dependent HslUV protease ATP-binding subunit HslU
MGMIPEYASSLSSLTPREIVRELDRFIIGQAAAKRAIAIALRNRYRRLLLPPEERREVAPKNILMIGPTGVGKTEIARRVADLAGAPFVKVEATKYSQVGYFGKDVESIVHNLAATAFKMVEAERMEAARPKASEAAENRLVDMLQKAFSSAGNSKAGSDGPRLQPDREILRKAFECFGQKFDDGYPDQIVTTEEPPSDTEIGSVPSREEILAKLRAGELETTEVEFDEEAELVTRFGLLSLPIDEGGVDLADIVSNRQEGSKRRVSVSEARQRLLRQEFSRLLDKSEIAKEAIERAEQTGIVFIDEIDKVASQNSQVGPEVSNEGVQRDLLPIVDGTTVNTKYGTVRTDSILFIAAGAFHVSRPSDLIPELQGRFPIRVELQPLGEEEFVRILREPENAVTKQYAKLLATEGVELEFTDGALKEIAKVGVDLNTQVQNIGARRLHAVIERLLEDVLFDATELRGTKVSVDEQMVRDKLGELGSAGDLSRYIL